MQHTSVHNSSGISFSRGVGLDGVERESGVCALVRSRVSTAGRYEHSLRLDILNRRLGNGQWSVSNSQLRIAGERVKPVVDKGGFILYKGGSTRPERAEDR